MSDSASTPIEILLEFSHTAVIKEKPVWMDGATYTHDWHLQVKASNGGNCENYLEKVVFRLHHTRPNHNREVKATPFEMRESGYGRKFTVPIDLYFKAPNNRFRKTRVNYDLVLQPNTDAGIPSDPDCERQIKMSRTEKFTFPTLDKGFRNRLLRGGGKLVDLPGRNGSSTSYKESSSNAVGSMEEENRRKGKHKRKKNKRKSRDRHRSIEAKEVEPPEEELDKDVKTSGIMDQVGLKMETDIKEEADNVRPKLENYCLLCQEYGHVLNDDCVMNVTCLSCGVKGHVRRDCYCLLCQEYGHVLSVDCTTCFNCGIKGHVRRDCSSENQRIANEQQ